MPLTNEILGTNTDGSQNQEYCIYCYKDGAFNGSFTMEEMVEFCSQYVEEYTINGNKVKLLNDNATYWGTQVENGNGRCFGIACDEHHILVSEYGKDSAGAELVFLKKR
ncbi:MAG: zinc ribbon domain-containing protein [Bacteroidales bacterium]|nr:zinc ribbon domain-containing protein [Bacteroidales bacterium]MDY6348799.1 zinc ribbon domain-containing protein [Bacteroidales bacterium]